MEIIHLVLGKANPERMNGVNKVVYQLATEQVKAGKAVCVWGITKDPIHNYGARNFKTELFRAYKNPFKMDEDLKKQFLQKRGKAVFHIHGGWIPLFYSISKFLAKNKIPFVYTPHGAYNSIAVRKSKWTKKLYFNLFEKFLLKRTKKIHCIGKSEVDGLIHIFPTDKTFLLPYGFELPEILHADKEAQGAFTIGFVGRLDNFTKGLDLLIEAAALLKNNGKNFYLWIIGDGGGKENLGELVLKNNLQDRVKLLGPKFGKDKDELISQLDVFVHPSRNEGLPSAVLEAASFGIPCIISEATNLGDAFRAYNSGMVIPNDDADALYQALVSAIHLSESQELIEIGLNARRMVREEFNWQKIVQDFDQLYT